VITYDNAGAIREAVSVVPLDRILLETDGPYMPPKPYKGRIHALLAKDLLTCTVSLGISHSGFIPCIAKCIAEVKKETTEVVLTTARENTKSLYGI